jgi:hypothetical protein
MRRPIALAAAVVLAASLAGSSVASTSASKLRFTGDFVQLSDAGEAMGRITAQLFEPTQQQLVPGSYDFVGAPGNGVRESHAVIGHTAFWFDPGHEGGSNVAYGDGVECVFFGVNDSVCHEWAVMFIDPVDGSVPNQVAFSIVRDASGAFDFNTETGMAWWYTVGHGDWEMKGDFPVG